MLDEVITMPEAIVYSVGSICAAIVACFYIYFVSRSI